MGRITKIIKEKRGKGQEFKSPPLAVPVGAKTPETANQALARLMLNSGVISRDDYEKMLGVRYDIENDEGVIFDDEDFADFEDDFKLSEWSDYEEQNLSNFSNSADTSNGISEPDGASPSPSEPIGIVEDGKVEE